MLNYLYCTLIGYAVGSVNPAFIMAKLRGFDIRKKGSHNAGASNVVILFGKVWGLVCALLDIGKAYLALWISETLMPHFAGAFAVTATACILGHIFPFYMKFRGGKGLACIGGTILYFDPLVFLIMLAVAVVLVLIVDYICIVPVAASVIFPAVYGIMTGYFPGAVILLLVTAVVILKHVENFRRIAAGTEVHLSYLWKPGREIERVKERMDATDEEVEERLGHKHKVLKRERQKREEKK